VAYKDEPAILGWELANELRCPSCRGTTRLVDTVRVLAAHARALLPHQLLGDGGEGFDEVPALYPGLSNAYPVRGDEGASFSRLLDVAELDLVSYHLYPGKWQLDTEGDVRIWIDSHETLARMAGKIAYLGEFGSEANPSARDQTLAPIFHHWLSHLFVARGGQMGLLWQWVPASRLADTDDGYAVAYDRDPLTAGVLAFWARSVR
jgi:mannan endo-1,4-beta-mannosidase